MCLHIWPGGQTIPNVLSFSSSGATMSPDGCVLSNALISAPSIRVLLSNGSGGVSRTPSHSLWLLLVVLWLLLVVLWLLLVVLCSVSLPIELVGSSVLPASSRDRRHYRRCQSDRTNDHKPILQLLSKLYFCAHYNCLFMYIFHLCVGWLFVFMRRGMCLPFE